MAEGKHKVLAISYLFPNSGAPDFGIFVMNRLKALSGTCEIKVINPLPWFPFSSRVAKYRHLSCVPRREIIHGLEVFHPRYFIIPGVLKFLDGITFLLAVIPLALRLRRQFDFSLIDLHWTYPDLPAGRLLSRLTNKKQLVTIRGKEALCPGEKSLRQWMIKKGIMKSHAVVALSRELGQGAQDLGADPGKISIIRNGVDLETFHPMDRAAARAKLKLDPDAYILLSVGSLIHRKGHDRVIQGLKSVLKVRPCARLFILGSQGPEGDFRVALDRMVRNLGLEGRVVFQGQVPHRELVYWYNAADLFCLLSRGEGSPNVLTEALACGCPGVATRVGAVEEILSSQHLGCLVPDDESRMAAALARAATVSWDRDKIAAHMKSFGWDWCAQKVLALYGSLLKDEVHTLQ